MGMTESKSKMLTSLSRMMKISPPVQRSPKKSSLNRVNKYSKIIILFFANGKK